MSARGVLVTPQKEEVGSRYKYRLMFERVADIRVVYQQWAPQAIWRASFAILFGDRSVDYQYAMAADVPYILVEHDLATARGKDYPHEKEMIEGARAVLFTSEDHLAYCEERYELPHTEVVHLRPLKADISFDPLPKVAGQNIVYAGGILSARQASSLVGYRTYHSIFEDLMECGWTVHIYPAPICRNHAAEYEAMGCVVHESLSMGELYRELSQYQAGLQAYSQAGPQDYITTCRPNKIWTYLAAGIPTLGINTGRAGTVYDGKWGVVDKGNLHDTTREVLNLDIPESLRAEQVIDNDLPAFERLLELVMFS